MRAEDAARGPSGHASQIHLRGAVRQLPAQDRRLGRAHGTRPHADLKLPPPTLVATVVAVGQYFFYNVVPPILENFHIFGSLVLHLILGHADFTEPHFLSKLDVDT